MSPTVHKLPLIVYLRRQLDNYPPCFRLSRAFCRQLRLTAYPINIHKFHRSPPAALAATRQLFTLIVWRGFLFDALRAALPTSIDGYNSLRVGGRCWNMFYVQLSDWVVPLQRGVWDLQKLSTERVLSKQAISHLKKNYNLQYIIWFSQRIFAFTYVWNTSL